MSTALDNMKKTLLLLGCVGAIAPTSAQNWLDTGNPSVTIGTNFLGAINNAPVDIRTNNTQRFRLNHNVSYTIGAFATQAKNGALGLSPNNTLWANGPGPFSRLHLHDGTTAVLSASYRSWMDNGITFKTNSDQMYIGHRVESGSDQTSAVIQWGDNEGAGAGPTLTCNA